jgi:hypothetical protein
MIPTKQFKEKQLYAPPNLEIHQWQVLTGVSLPIGSVLSDNPISEWLEQELEVEQ